MLFASQVSEAVLSHVDISGRGRTQLFSVTMSFDMCKLILLDQ